MKRFADLHCDTLMGCYFGGMPLRDLPGHINTEKLINGGCLLQCMATFITSDGTYAWQKDPGNLDGKAEIVWKEASTGRRYLDTREDSCWILYKGMKDTFYRVLEEEKDSFRQAKSIEDVRKNAADGFSSLMLTVEDGMCIAGKLERIKEMYDDGVRMLALTWNFENCFGYPNSKNDEDHKRGLKPFGKEASAMMQDIGMIIDVSHLSEGGFWDVVNISKNTHIPFIASHSCARALCSHQRNLTDEQLRAVADCGGVVGINFNGKFLVDDQKDSFAKDVVRHVKHMKNVAGSDILSWGSDFDGISSKLDFGDYLGLEIIEEMLKSDFSEDEIEKMNNKNFLRVLADQK